MKTIVVGAGGGGIASAILAAVRGEEVTLLEGHSKLGGCASYFKRGPYLYDAGATTLSGLETNKPLCELFELIGNKPDLYLADPGIVFHLSCGKVIHYYRDFDRWMDELKLHFPEMDHRPFWELVRKIDQKSWKFLKEIKHFPFKELSDLQDLIKYPSHAGLVPYLLVSTDHMLKKYGLDQHDYLELVNGILIISAQTLSQRTPFLVGAMGLSYPSETYAPVGGMKGVMDFFEKELLRLGVKLEKRAKVESFSEKGNKVSVKLLKGDEEKGERLILNLPIWNLSSMSEGQLSETFLEEGEKNPGGWGAFCLYFGITSSVEGLYHQVHLASDIIPNYFASFSIPDDESRAPKGERAVTISFHVPATEWIGLSKDEYESKKKALSDIVLEDFKKRFKVDELKMLTLGTPKTFERYTGRKNGFVGGVPFVYGKSPFALLSPVTSSPEIFRVGDTTYPGQGLVGVVAGALALHERLK